MIGIRLFAAALLAVATAGCALNETRRPDLNATAPPECPLFNPPDAGHISRDDAV